MYFQVGADCAELENALKVCLGIVGATERHYDSQFNICSATDIAGQPFSIWTVDIENGNSCDK